MSFSTSSPHPRPWEEKNPFVAGILAYLVPGAGHLYQGRTTKGLIYFFSILGLFIWGQRMGEGMVVYNVPERGSVLRYVSLGYAAQMGAGAVSLPAFLQNRRAASPDNRTIRRLSQPLVADFEGQLHPAENSEDGKLIGKVRLESVEGPSGSEVRGTFEGTLDGKPTKLALGGSRFELDAPIKAGFRRDLHCGLEDDVAAFPPKEIVGTIPRSFVDAYASPPDPDQLQEINGRLGKTYELAMVFTWIAGLLNVLAIWDCVLGPAYGFGDEHVSIKSDSSQSATSSSPSAAGAPPSTTDKANSTVASTATAQATVPPVPQATSSAPGRSDGPPPKV